MQIISFLMGILDAVFDIESRRPLPPGAGATPVTALEDPWGPPPWPKSN